MTEEEKKDDASFWDPLKSGPVPKKVDEDWKRKAREETKKFVAPPGGDAAAKKGEKPAPAAKPSPVFVEFLTEIATQAAYHLQGRQLEQARYTIDILETLREKTKGNLADDEQKLLDRYLYELQMQYVQLMKGAAKRSHPEHA